VIVLASNGYTDTSMGGGTNLRDFDEPARYDFAAYCSGEATRWGGDSLTPFQPNVPVVLPGVGVVPGQYVFADSSGAVLIPDSQIDEVLAEARKVEATDAASRDQIAREQVRVNDHLR
jgi:4-hydroxy-4-methyl-2-oxoglutarate aldolase